jgi:methylthioribose-1-phosphate isomerase
VAWTGHSIRLIDQTALPSRLAYVEICTWEDAVEAIRTMVVRGAPAIGCTAALGMALAARDLQNQSRAGFREGMERAAESLCGSRPTAVNLSWAVKRILNILESSEGEVSELTRAAEAEAVEMLQEDLASNRRIGMFGAELMPESGSVLTHCNAGALCAAGYGTALGVIRGALEAGKRIHVFADETRPRLQGMKLTAWELQQDGIPVTVIADNMAGVLMKEGRINCIVVGADRIAANGDTANKIGTYGLAVLARHHGIPLYVAAPLSTVDFALPNGDRIPIEERSLEEMTHLEGQRIAPRGVEVLNPAFDVTPNELISAIITDRGIARAPFAESLQLLVIQNSPKR